jgi:hypothetical protein
MEGVVQHSITVHLPPPPPASIPHRGNGQDKPYFTSPPKSRDARYGKQFCRLPAGHGSLLNSAASVNGAVTLASDTYAPTYPSWVYVPLRSHTRF